MPTSAPTSPQLAVYAKLLCLLMVVVCGVAAPMEEKVRLFSEKTKGFVEASRKGHFVSARNVTFSKFTNLTIRSTSEIGVVELVFADLAPNRRLCMDKSGKLKAMKKLSTKRRQPGCLFRECVDGLYFFYLSAHARPRLLGFQGRDQFNPPGPTHCCDVARGPAGEEGEHLVPDGSGRYTCQRRRAHRTQVDFFFFLKKRQENATLADAIPAHNHRQGGHNRLPFPAAAAAVDPALALRRGDDEDAEPHPRRRPQHRRQQQQQQHPRHRGTSLSPPPRPPSSSTTTTTTEASRQHHQLHLHHLHNHRQQQQRLLQRNHHHQQQQQQPHRTRHHHHLTPMFEETTTPALRTPRPPRPSIRVRHRKVASVQRDASSNFLVWD